MRAFWLALLIRAIQHLAKRDWAAICGAVTYYLSEDMPGKEKQLAAIRDLRAMGSTAATWLLGAAIDIAYGQITGKSLEQGAE